MWYYYLMYHDIINEVCQGRGNYCRYPFIVYMTFFLSEWWHLKICSNSDPCSQIPALWALEHAPFAGNSPASAWRTWIARDSVNCRYLIAFFWGRAEEFLKVRAHRLAWLEKTKTLFSPRSNPLGSLTRRHSCLAFQSHRCSEAHNFFSSRLFFSPLLKGKVRLVVIIYEVF